ncbi:HEAT repeat protein [Roseimicrobium gellanilyticum]|uniref:HEAT repeat protein n=1 Tax=Roseimicrobium gellanilyticum TaxID=748857 RepID=A0A366HP84_9BACT|nr:DUF4132 domain-containing protein [Roseimicrobium gellanilyticum]RBP44596.1 HEAT repeat protein [Roseimicrobium gellanilyticum]
MSKILKLLDAFAKETYSKDWHHPSIKRYIETGDDAQLAAIPKMPYRSGSWQLAYELPDPDAWTEEADRVLKFAVTRNVENLLTTWLERYCRYTSARPEQFDAAVQKYRSMGINDAQLREWVLHSRLVGEDGAPTPAGSLMLEGDDKELAANLRQQRFNDVGPLLARSAPDRLERMLDDPTVLKRGDSLLSRIVHANAPRFHTRAFDYYKSQGSAKDNTSILMQLGEKMPEKYLTWACGELKTLMRGESKRENFAGSEDYMGRSICEYLVKHRDPDALPVSEEWMAGYNEKNPWNAPFQRELILKAASEVSPEMVLPLAEACTRCGAGNVVLMGLKYWKLHGTGDSVDRYHAALQRLLANADNSSVVSGISECREWDMHRTQEDIWPLMLHKSRPVRGAAARALATLGYAAAGARALKLLAHKKADIRQAAVSLLSQIGDEEAMAKLKQHMDLEENDDVRDAILLALENSGGGSALTPEELAERVAKTLSKIKGPPVAWIDPAAPSLTRTDGNSLSKDEVLYLLTRQSRCKEMRADLEAKPLYASLDRKACGETAVSVVKAFLGSKQDAADRWVLAFAALIGDDRIVPPLTKAIHEWADKQRGKLAEYAAQALALLATEPALMVVDSLSVRYRSKNKNIGQAAAEAFAAAAEARGVSVEELGDLVVPWLGFEAGSPRLVTAGKGKVEVSITDDLKLSFRDTASRKTLSKLPSGTDAATQAEFKELAATLREAVKAQLLRIETLLVRQFRWPTERWWGLYASHPLLLPFAHRLVWSWRDEDGVLAKTFRLLDDGSLTDVEDNMVSLPPRGTVSLVHPLELDDAQRQAWIQHLADYNVEPPFSQLDRPVVTVNEEERGLKFGKQVEGTSLNAMTFRSRSEKLGWTRGSVVDGGGVSSYRKTFSGAGIEAFLLLDGMYIGISMDESITLGTLSFVKAGTVTVGSYIYDEPHKEDDPRLLAFGDVPPVPFSEVMGDLTKIAGKTADAPTAEA